MLLHSVHSKITGFISILCFTISALITAPVAAQVLIEVQVSDGSAAIDGAFVTYVWNGEAIDLNGDGVLESAGMAVAGATTNANGWSIPSIAGEPLPDGTYEIAASKPGYQMGFGELVVAEASGTAELTLVKNDSRLSYVNTFGAQVQNVIADGSPCVFYATTDSFPYLFRSTDCAGTWSPVTQIRDENAETTGDDGIQGIQVAGRINRLTTSGFPGEVAVESADDIWYSRDFGTSWQHFLRPMSDVDPMTGTESIQWVHAIDKTVQPNVHSSYMITTFGGTNEVAIQQMPIGVEGTLADSTPLTDPVIADAVLLNNVRGDGSGEKALVRAAVGASNVWIAIAKSTGTKIFKIAANANPSDISLASAVATIDLMRESATWAFDTFVFGGPTDNDLGIPTGMLLWDRETGNGAVATGATWVGPNVSDWLITDSMMHAGSWFEATTPEPVDRIQQDFSRETCGENETMPVGSIAPVNAAVDATNWDGFATMGMLRSCLAVVAIVDATVRETLIPAGTLLLVEASGANNTTGSAFSAGFNLQDDQVVVSGDGAHGLVKSATFHYSGDDQTMVNGEWIGSTMRDVSGPYAWKPLFPGTQTFISEAFTHNQALPGTAATSGGFAVVGLNAPAIKDIAASPYDPEATLMGMSFTGGGRTVMSLDGGQTYFTVGGGGSNAVAWWVDENGTQWIAGNSSGTANAFLSARAISTSDYLAVKSAVGAGQTPDAIDWSGPTLAFPHAFRGNPEDSNGFGSKTFALGDWSQGQFTGEMNALAGIGGTKKLLVAGTRGYFFAPELGWSSTIALVTLGGTDRASTLEDVKYLQNDGSWIDEDELVDQTLTDPTFTDVAIPSMQYCPIGSAPVVADRAFIALADENDLTSTKSGLRVIDGIAAGSPEISDTNPAGLSLGSTDNVRDVKVDCDSGVVLLSSRDPEFQYSDSNGIWISFDGARSFTKMQIVTGGDASVRQPETADVEINPESGETRIVAIGGGGDAVATTFNANEFIAGTGLTVADISSDTLTADQLAQLAQLPTLSVVGELINDPNDIYGLPINQPGDIEFPVADGEEVPIATESAGGGFFSTYSSHVPATFPQNSPQLGTGIGAFAADIAGIEGGMFSPIRVTADGSSWNPRVTKQLAYGSSLQLAVQSEGTVTSIKSSGACKWTSRNSSHTGILTANDASGNCSLNISTRLPGGGPRFAEIWKVDLTLASVEIPKNTTLGIPGTLQVSAQQRIGKKTATLKFRLDPSSASVCSIRTSRSSMKITAKTVGECKLFVTSAGVARFVEPLTADTPNWIVTIKR